MLSFKKTSVIVLSSFLLLVGCQEENDLVGVDNDILQDAENDGNRGQEHRIDALKYELINNLDDLIHSSHAIIMGTVLDANPFNSTGTYKYTVLVDSALMGPASSNAIDVYAGDKTLEVGKKYALFLGYFESELYANPIYNFIDQSLIIEIQGNNLIGPENIIAGKTTKELMEYINIKDSNLVSLATTYSASVGHVVIDSVDSVEELINISDNIIHIVTDVIGFENPNIRSFDVSIVDVLKGTIASKTMRLDLPSAVEVGKEYIVFLQDGPEYRIATRNGSVVSKEDEKTWQAILEQVGK